jgi:hypothetical protein
LENKGRWELELNILWPFVIALVSWIALNAIGKPVLQFLDLRKEIRRTMLLYANVRARWTDRDWENVAIPETSGNELSPDENERLMQAQTQYRDLGVQMRAFADTESPTCFCLKWFGFDPRQASSGLIGLSNSLSTYGKERAFHTKTVTDALAFPEG